MVIMRFGILHLCFLALACSDPNPTGPTTAADALGETTVSRGTWGDPCMTDDNCATGLCVLTEYAPFRFCTAECEVEEEGCPADADGNFGGWCAKMPADYPDSPKQFCLPVCKDIHECQAKTALWERCDPPSWKGNIIYGSATGVRACQAPSAAGKVKVDPVTCEGWTENFKEYQPEIGMCRAYCDYLVTCKEVKDSAIYNKECCAWGCMLQSVIDGTVDTLYQKDKQCYVQNFSAFQGTPKVCSGATDDCGANPEDPRQ